MKFLREYVNGGWKKLAAAAGGTSNASTEEIEMAFADQAYHFIANKATPLMKAPYRMGFEVVYRNDANTRMVGIFIFRIGKTLLYAPAFFLNGSIKGTDLLHRLNEKRFVPLTPDWCDYIIGLSSAQSEGTGVPVSERMNTRNELELNDIIAPPSTVKMAKELLDQIESTPREFSPLLETFMQEHGSAEVLVKLSNAIAKDRRFAEAFATLDMSKLRFTEKTKTATSKRIRTGLRIHTDVLTNPNVKKASAEEIGRNLVVEDERDPKLVNDVIYENSEQTISALSAPGPCDLLLRDGSMTEALIVYHGERPSAFKKSDGGGDKLCGSTPEWSKPHTRLGILLKDPKRYSADFSTDKPLYGKESTQPFDWKSYGQDLPTAGKAYVILDAANKRVLGYPIYVSGVVDNMGTKRIQFYRYWMDQDAEEFLYNPDFSGVSYDEGILGGCCRFVEVDHTVKEKRVDYDTSISPGDSYAINLMIFGNGYKKASVIKESDDQYVVKFQHQKKAYRLNRVQAVGALLLDGALREPEALGIMEKAAANGRFDFLYKSPADLIKAAYNQQFNDWPDWNTYTDSEFGVNAENPTQELLPVDRTEPAPIEARLGDFVRHEGQNENITPDLETMTPVQLFELSQQTGMSNLFQHGVVGELTQTFDSMGMVERYLPDMEQALDRLGRLLFLFYWKPEDFAAAYGSDDQSQLENKFLSNFKSFGQLVLELLRKNKSIQQGSVAMI